MRSNCVDVFSAYQLRLGLLTQAAPSRKSALLHKSALPTARLQPRTLDARTEAQIVALLRRAFTITGIGVHDARNWRS